MVIASGALNPAAALVTLSPESLFSKLVDLAGEPRGRLLVAFSGGMDSSVLLHLASRIDAFPASLAVHVDHALHPDSAAWADDARAFAESLGMEFVSVRREVREQGDGLEAAARNVRYGFFESLLDSADWLLSAQHADDQAETLLLHLLRGSGPLGMSGMPALRACGKGTLLRPLLNVPRASILAYARQHSLSWTDDPSNNELRFDRNFVRHKVMPVLHERWAAATRQLGRSAMLAGEAQELLDALGALDLESCGEPGRLRLAPLSALPSSRQRNLLRFSIKQLGLPSIPATRLREILLSVIPAREDASPLVSWSGGEARRYRNRLYLQSTVGDLQLDNNRLVPGQPLPLGPGLGELRLVLADAGGLDPTLVEAGLKVSARAGGEQLRPAPESSTRALKTLFQEAGVLPWMRPRIPLLKSEDRVVAVADLWLDAEFVAKPGFQVHWSGRPAVY